MGSCRELPREATLQLIDNVGGLLNQSLLTGDKVHMAIDANGKYRTVTLLNHRLFCG
jgi:hypothetical protein